MICIPLFALSNAGQVIYWVIGLDPLFHFLEIYHELQGLASSLYLRTQHSTHQKKYVFIINVGISFRVYLN